MSHTNRDANLLGALSLAVAGRMLSSGGEMERLGPSGAAALIALSSWADGHSIEELSRILGLSHSGAVRLVDRLEREGLLRRRAGSDGRSVALSATREGARLGEVLREERAGALESVLEPLGAAQRARLVDLLERLLHGIAREGEAPGRICRLCDPVGCGHYDNRCPVTLAAHA